MPMVTALPFFPPFFIANFCLFCQKGKSSVLTALPFCLFVFVSVLFLLCWESLLFFSSFLAPIHFLPQHPHLDHHVPPSLPPEAAVCLAIPVDAATRCLSPLPFPSPSLFRSSPFQLIVVFPPTAIAVAAVVFIALPLPWLSPSLLLLPSHLPSPQLHSSPPPSTPLPSLPLSPTTAATAAIGSKRWLSALALSAGSQRMASALGFSACLSALALIAWLS
jgi:hypothetical protein